MSEFQTKDPYSYFTGLNSYHESEAIPGTLPIGRNSPQVPAFGLYAEKLSGAAFTAPRHLSKQTWLYRILPSTTHRPFEAVSTTDSREAQKFSTVPNQIRWSPFEIDTSADFVGGLKQLAGAGDIQTKNGVAIYIYSCGKSMKETDVFYSSDGDMLIVPQEGDLDVRTELGRLYVRPLEILVIPRGIRYNVALPNGNARGYILEAFSATHFELPELGPIGSAGLANARDFQIPKAEYTDSSETHTLINKFGGNLFRAEQDHSPFDIVGWHGTYYPFKYDLGRYNAIGSISYDHPDPSIFTVLTVPSPIPGTAIADFAIFAPRWLVMEDSFRPPYFHRNCMGEFVGLIKGGYDGKLAGGFNPGGASLHNLMSAHGPDVQTHRKASEEDTSKPQKVGTGSMAFMFEVSYMVGVTEWGLKESPVQQDYVAHSWGGFKKHFKPPQA
ncbi:putative homogentisate 1,2-dioxygenase [Sphaerosporella brunnea]|uniref:homogentisate 1,2-dioxygenase n=1 Tax=Sphaerosporella brunnea TaxID=1250544 RepID=A0A5J5F150_9PEZI|nr:putative homogentisate 1,2-dioxygenase [Sphaerosporella brunnea]